MDSIGRDASSSTESSSSYRNLSACNRCRVRKNRCDQQLPACSSCQKAGVKCVGFDPITRREIPRSYVHFIESRNTYLESLLRDYNIPVAAAEEHLDSSTIAHKEIKDSEAPRKKHKRDLDEHASLSHGGDKFLVQDEDWDRDRKEADRLNKLVPNIGMVSAQGTPDPRYLGSTSGISFARVVFAAVKSSQSGSHELPEASEYPARDTSMRDSFFGLKSKSVHRTAPFPKKAIGVHLVELFLSNTNLQFPVVPREQLILTLNRTYAIDERSRSASELYLLNIVFAIGAAISASQPGEYQISDDGRSGQNSSVPPKSGIRDIRTPGIGDPLEYHASAIVFLESVLGGQPASSGQDDLEGLQAILLLACFALYRPVSPGLWYIVGVALRLAIDLGLHVTDGDRNEAGKNSSNTARINKPGMEIASKQSSDNAGDGHEHSIREWKRRLWWSVYSLDRIVSITVCRPCGSSDHTIATDLPSTTEELDRVPDSSTSMRTSNPSGEITLFYLQLRILQLEIISVLQYQQARSACRPYVSEEFAHKRRLPSPWLAPYTSIYSWRHDLDARLGRWKNAFSTSSTTGDDTGLKTFELEYWKTLLLLYRGPLEKKEWSVDVSGINLGNPEYEEMDFSKIAEAGQQVLRLHRKLHRTHELYMPFLATHYILMAGIAFLFAMWHSPDVRMQYTLEDVDVTILSATSVLNDLIHVCTPAEACRDALERMAKATVKMCLSTTGFGLKTQSAGPGESSVNSHGPRFDIKLRDVLHEESRNIDTYRSEERNTTEEQVTRSPHDTAPIAQKRNLSFAQASTPQENREHQTFNFGCLDFIEGDWEGDWDSTGNAQFPDLFDGFFFGGPSGEN